MKPYLVGFVLVFACAYLALLARYLRRRRGSLPRGPQRRRTDPGYRP